MKNLNALDKKAARKINPKDTVRIIRALEGYSKQAVNPLPKNRRRIDSMKDLMETLRIGLVREREILFGRIDRRADQMIADGFTREVQSLLDRRYDETLKPMQSMGYKHMVIIFKESASLQEAVRLMKRGYQALCEKTNDLVRHRPGNDVVFSGDFDAS